MGKLERFVMAVERIADALDGILAQMVRRNNTVDGGGGIAPVDFQLRSGPVKFADETHDDFARRLYRWKLSQYNQ